MLPLSSRVSLSVEPFLLSSGIDMFEDIVEGVRVFLVDVLSEL
jgi:hypothetical protein